MDSFAHFADFLASFAVKSSLPAASKSYRPETSAAATAARASGADEGVTEAGQASTRA